MATKKPLVLEGGRPRQAKDDEIAADWTAEVVSQAEAEAGTATTPRKWTAERVSQAIRALGGGGGSGIVPPISTTATYDAAGRVHAVTDTFAGGRVSVATVAYTPQGAVSSVTTTSDGSTRTETYTYNPDGSFASMSAA